MQYVHSENPCQKETKFRSLFFSHETWYKLPPPPSEALSAQSLLIGILILSTCLCNDISFIVPLKLYQCVNTKSKRINISHIVIDQHIWLLNQSIGQIHCIHQRQHIDTTTHYALYRCISLHFTQHTYIVHVKFQWSHCIHSEGTSIYSDLLSNVLQQSCSTIICISINVLQQCIICECTINHFSSQNPQSWINFEATDPVLARQPVQCH